MTATATITQLNSYTGDNIWQDIVEHIDYDRAATEAADPADASDVIVLTDGTVIRYDHAAGAWTEA